MPKAVRDWPSLNFITYHSCMQSGMFMADALDNI